MSVVDANSLLKFSNSQDLLQFLHFCIDEMVGKSKISMDSFNNEIELTKDELKKTKNYVQVLFTNLAHHKDFKIDLQDSIQEAIRNCFTIRKEDIENHVKYENIVNSGLLLVENFDWKLKWVIGSSSFATLCEPLVQIDFNCGGNGNIKENVNFEMTFEQVERMIEELEMMKTKIK
ncbi:COMM domain-containing protein 8-like [Onthophagus taurus]|uniref:COMM domain-containing protein 8-like n=1 Tax=Onthophagus taurus TaxID=166361 RepID=UPI000C20D206|nr:uncharacterized protein LOC111415761 [Onthophagus taurus]